MEHTYNIEDVIKKRLLAEANAQIETLMAQRSELENINMILQEQIDELMSSDEKHPLRQVIAEQRHVIDALLELLHVSASNSYWGPKSHTWSGDK